MNPNKEYLGWLSALNHVVVVICIWIFAATALMLFLWVWPKTFLGWVVGLFVVPIVYVLAEGLGGLILAGVHKIPGISRMRKSVLERNEGKTVSSERIAYLLFELVFFVAILGGAGYGIYRLSGDTFDPIISFFKENYY